MARIFVAIVLVSALAAGASACSGAECNAIALCTCVDGTHTEAGCQRPQTCEDACVDHGGYVPLTFDAGDGG